MEASMNDRRRRTQAGRQAVQLKSDRTKKGTNMRTTTRWTQIATVAVIVTGVMAARPAFALANWSRKYQVDCVTCHSPAVPRLNAFGHQFRKMGYRMDTEIKGGKPEAYKELGNFTSVRFRTGFNVEHFNADQKAGDGFNKFRTRSGFIRPDVTLFYAGALSEHLTLFSEIEFVDADETEVQVFGEWFTGNSERWLTVRMGQMHTLSRIGWGGFDRPSGITTPDSLSGRKLTTSPVSFRIGEDQRGLDLAYNFTPESRIIAGVYNGVNQQGAGNEGNGAGFGDNDNKKDVLLAYEQMFGESGFTFFGYYGSADQKAGTMYNASGNVITTGVPFLTTADSKGQTEFNFLRVGATASWVFHVFDQKKIGNSELQGGYMYAKDFYPSALPFDDRDGHAFWVGLEQRLPHDSAVFYRYDRVMRSDERSRGARQRHTLGCVYTYEQYLRLSAEGFIYDQSADSYGILFQAMLNF